MKVELFLPSSLFIYDIFYGEKNKKSERKKNATKRIKAIKT